MNLSAEQVAAAEAAGCRFLPAPADALHRFAMQRKLFRASGREVLATRGGGLYETASTLQCLIAEGLKLLSALPRVMPEPPEPSPVAESAPPAAAEPPPVPRRKRVRAAPAPSAPAFSEPPAPEPAVSAGSRAAAATAIPPRSRRHHAEPPRWSTAGAERRGRAAVHWSTRVR